MDFIVYAFILIYLPKYILHSFNIYDLGNSLWHTALCRIPIEDFICICCSNLIRIYDDFYYCTPVVLLVFSLLLERLKLVFK